MDKIFYIDKKMGVSSYDVIRDIKHKFNITKIGHAGTLDPFATGLLIIMVGETTKVSNFLMSDIKEYEATIKLGIGTDSYDLDGNIIERKEVPNITTKDILDVFEKFKGDIKQVPPMYSAIKVNGKKLYELARKNQEIDLKPRDVHIYNLDLISFEKNEIRFKCMVSKGTYIRSLGVDIAKALNTVGHLTSLRRIRVGKASIKDAIDVVNINEENGYNIKDCLDMKQVVIDESLIKDGKRIKLDIDDEYVLLLNKDRKEIAIYQKDENEYKSLRGFNL